MTEPLNDQEFYIYKGMRFSFVNAKEWQRLIATVESLKDKLKIADEAGMAWIKLCDKRKEENAKINEKIDALETNILDKKYQIEDLHTEPIRTVLNSAEGKKYLKEAIRLLGDDEDMMRLFPNHFKEENAKLKAELEREWKDEEWDGEYGLGDEAERRATEIVTKYHSKWTIIWALAHELRLKWK